MTNTPDASQPETPIAGPNATIGILGGGQLGRMLSMAAAQLGLKTHILAPEDKCPAADCAGAWTRADYDDEAALKEFADLVDVITFEFENVPAHTVEFLSAMGAQPAPGGKALAAAQDRLVEKQFIQSIGAETAPYMAVDSLDSLEIALNKIGRPAILKTRRLGYDGKGQTTITDADKNLHGTWEKAKEHAWSEIGAQPSILEGFVDFECEISIIGARGRNGDTALYAPTRNFHRNGILRTSTVPANVSEATADLARKITADLLENLDYVGVIGVEFFVLKSGGVMVNEFAPRVHNSGHWTMDACAVSQFEQHIRAVAGWPLGDPTRHSNAMMENLIGDEAEQWWSLARERQHCLHLYGKREARPGRKMGHVTMLKAR